VETGRNRIPVKHLDRIQGILRQIVTNQLELFQNIVCHRDDMTAYRVGLEDIQ
jgi:hypothetical protein